jgi:hypothetical protein
MKKTLLAVAAVALAALAPTMATAAIQEFKFNSVAITATFTIDVVSGQAVNGVGELWSPYWTGPASMTLVTLSTTDVHELGGGSLSYRFGGGTDLIGTPQRRSTPRGSCSLFTPPRISTWGSTS